MQLATFHYTEQGWSTTPFPDLDSDQTMIIVFGASTFYSDDAPLRELRASYPASHFIGCSTAGEIFQDAIHDQSLAVAVLAFEHTRLASARAEVAQATDSYEAGRKLATELYDGELQSLFVLSEGVTVNGSELVRGLNSVLPPNIVVTGGLAGDGDQFERTWVLGDGRPEQGIVVAVGMYGDRVRITHGSQGGWEIFGPERLVTHARENILYELDGQPALQLYKEYLGEQASELPASAMRFPLALRRAADDEAQIVRTILAVDEETQSLTFAGDIPQGHLAQLMKASFYGLIDGAIGAAAMASPNIAAPENSLAIAISCVGRRLVLGEYTEEELEAALEVLPPGIRQIGFYSYGEISPYAPGYCDLHNQTMTLTTIGES